MILFVAIQNSYDAGNHDPCNSKFKTDNVDILCETILDNDLSDILENDMDYPVVICHSPEDDLIYFSNVPNTTMNDNLIMIQDVPIVGDVVKPSGNHSVAGRICTMGFLFPFVAPPETSNVRSILPIDDPDGTCSGGVVSSTTSTISSSGGVTNTSSTTLSSDVVVTTLATSSSGGVTNTTTTTTSSTSSSGVETVVTTKSPTLSPTGSPSSVAFAVSSFSGVVATMIACGISVHSLWTLVNGV